MGILSTSNSYNDYYSKRFAEALYLLGTEVKLYQLVNKSDADLKYDYASDPLPKYMDPVSANILFDANPQAKLKKLGWLAEGEDLPLLAYISNHSKSKESSEYSDIVVTQYCLIEVPYSLRKSGTQKFIVTDILSEGLVGSYWTCKLAPYRESVDMDPSTPEVDITLPKNESDTSYINFKY